MSGKSQLLAEKSIGSLSTMMETPPLQEIRETQFSRSVTSGLDTVVEEKNYKVTTTCHNQMPNRFEESMIEKQYGLNINEYNDHPGRKVLSAFDLYSSNRKPFYSGKYEGMELIRKVTIDWACLSFEEKERYKQYAEEDKKRLADSLKDVPMPRW